MNNETRSPIAAQSKRRLRFPWFYLVLLILVAAALVYASSLAEDVKDYLSEYESVQPKYEAEKTYKKYFSPVDYDALLELSDAPEITPYETKEDLIEYLRSIFEGDELSYNPISAGSTGAVTVEENADILNIGQYLCDKFNAKGNVKYIVKSGDSKIAEFVLSQTGEKTGRGFITYELDSLSLFYAPHESVTVYIPKTATLTLNGVKVESDKLVADVYDETDSCKHVPEGTEGLIYVAYFADKMYQKPEISVTDKDGLPLPVVYDEEKKLYSAEAQYSETLKEQYGDYVLTAIKNYAAYMQYDGARRDFIDYFDTDSELWANIISTENYFVLDHDSWSFKDEKVSEFYQYSEDVFSCRVAFTHLLHRDRNKYYLTYEDYVDYIDFTLYLKRGSDGVFRIYDCFTNN